MPRLLEVPLTDWGDGGGFTPLLLGCGQRLLAGLINGSRDAVWLLRLDPGRSGTHFVHRIVLENCVSH